MLRPDARSYALLLASSACVVPALRAQAPESPSSRKAALERALQEPPIANPAATTPPTPLPVPVPQSQPGQLRLIDVSLDIAGAVGGASERDSVLGDLQGGGHDPRKRGFTFQQAELSLAGAVDPYFTAEAHIVWFLDPIPGETVVELEEGFVTTQALPYGLQVKAGHYLTEFGRSNPTHPHAWDWLDQPIIGSRVFGPDGMRAPGARLSWLLPTAHYTELIAGVQNANGEQMSSFLANDGYYSERPIGGRAFTQRDVRSLGDMVYSLRLQAGFDLSDTMSTAFGASAAFGPNATGNGARTAIYGIDGVWKWRPLSNEHGYPFVRVQGEAIARDFEAAAQTDAADPFNPVAVPGTTLHDYGGYLQVLWGFTPDWELGLRGEWVGGAGASYDASTQSFGRDHDMFRADRYRLSPLLGWHPSEFSRLRLQYNYDDTDALADPVHAVWLSFEVLIGKHPAHKY